MSEDRPRPNDDGRTIGEGPERHPDGSYNKSGVGRREQAQKEAGNPKERQAEAERIAREKALYEREDDPGRTR